jgi:hypothetical protein
MKRSAPPVGRPQEQRHPVGHPAGPAGVPLQAVREALLNALAHRDSSSYVRGSYVQVRLFADRPEIQSPGGLFGNVTPDNLKDEQSTRNTALMRLLEDLHLVENRGSGIKTALKYTNLRIDCKITRPHRRGGCAPLPVLRQRCFDSRQIVSVPA